MPKRSKVKSHIGVKFKTGGCGGVVREAQAKSNAGHAYIVAEIQKQCGFSAVSPTNIRGCRAFYRGLEHGRSPPVISVEQPYTELKPPWCSHDSDELKQHFIKLNINTDGYSENELRNLYRGLNFHGLLLLHFSIIVKCTDVRLFFLDKEDDCWIVPFSQREIAVFISIVTGVAIAPVTDAHALPAILEYAISAGLKSVISCVLSFFSLNGWSQPLKSTCVLDFLAENFLVYVKYMDQAQVELILALVKNPKLNVPSEEALLDALVRWGRSHDVLGIVRALKLEYVPSNKLAKHLLFREALGPVLSELMKNATLLQLRHPELTRLATDPISMELYEDPVLCPDGRTYSKSVLIACHNVRPGVSPMTREPMSTATADARRNQWARDLCDIVTPTPPRSAYLDKNVPEFNH
jgi:hypothetical protein